MEDNFHLIELSLLHFRTLLATGRYTFSGLWTLGLSAQKVIQPIRSTLLLASWIDQAGAIFYLAGWSIKFLLC
jgi:hypothetical protein